MILFCLGPMSCRSDLSNVYRKQKTPLAGKQLTLCIFLYYINITFFFSVVNVQPTVCRQAKFYMDSKTMKR